MIYLLEGVADSDSHAFLMKAFKKAGLEVSKSRPSAPKEGDVVMTWGYASRVPLPPGVRGLNCGGRGDKLQELVSLKEGGISIPSFSITSKEGVEGWYGRERWHSGADDLLHVRRPSYWVKKVDAKVEFRIHIFNGLCILLGVKVPIPDFEGTPHPWIRSVKRGWYDRYEKEFKDEVPQSWFPKLRAEAKRAVKALSLQNGGVDIAMTKDGPVVFEVNTMPGLEYWMAEYYAEAMKAYAG